MDYSKVDLLSEFSLWQAATSWCEVEAINAENLPENKIHAVDTVLDLLKAAVLDKKLPTIRRKIFKPRVDVFNTVVDRNHLLEFSTFLNVRPAFLYPESRLSKDAGDSPVRQTQSVALVAASNNQPIVTHKIANRSRTPMEAEIGLAESAAVNRDDAHSVWAELTKLAERGTGAMIGYSSDGIQYRGKQHQATGVPDVFKFKNLRDRIHRQKKRA